HAILTAEPMIGDQAFGVILADDLCFEENEGVMAQMVALYQRFQCSIVAIEEVPKSDTDKYGIVQGEEIETGIYRVNNMVEKPSPELAPSNLAIIGRYILTPDIFNILASTKPGRGGEIQITDALLEQAKV